MLCHGRSNSITWCWLPTWYRFRHLTQFNLFQIQSKWTSPYPLKGEELEAQRKIAFSWSHSKWSTRIQTQRAWLQSLCLTVIPYMCMLDGTPVPVSTCSRQWHTVMPLRGLPKNWPHCWSSGSAVCWQRGPWGIDPNHAHQRLRNKLEH